MSFIVPSHNLPTVGLFVYRYLVSLEGASVERDRLLSLLVPPGMEGPAGVNDEAGPYAPRHTIRSLTQLGILAESGGEITLSDSLTDDERSPADPNVAFPKLVRRVVLAQSTDVWTLKDSSWSTEGASDLIRAVTWILAQDALGPPLSFGSGDRRTDAEMRQSDELRAAEVPVLVADSTPWGNLERWGPYLGLLGRLRLPGRTYLTPDPTVAVRDALLEALAPTPNGAVSLPKVISRLAELIPVLDAGAHQRELTRLIARDRVDSGPAVGSSAVSQALLTLREAKFIELELWDDAKEITVLYDRPSPQRFSHVRLGKEVP